MGLPMARHLVAAGHDVIACDLVPERAAALGVGVAESPGEAAGGADCVILSLPEPRAVAEALFGPAGVGAGADPGALVIDMSTSPPALARRAAQELRHLEVLDAPVSGGPTGAEQASLTVMVGGGEDGFARARPLLETVGRLVVHVGPHGAGQAAKLCNNLIAGTTMAAIAEACAIAVREGLDSATLYALLSASTGDSRVLRTRYPLGGVRDEHPSSNGFAPLFALDLIAKDLALALELGDEHELAAPVAAAALDSYRTAQALGLGALDYSAVYRSTGQ
jgi:3-hydroxyisobutyrate dehydrogenase-like beta-hydroxyacid dehydrogenase